MQRHRGSKGSPFIGLAIVIVVLMVVPATVVAATEHAASSAETWWTAPPGSLPWQWYLDGALNLSSPTDMGTNDTLPGGSAAPNPVVYDIDGIDNSAGTVTSLHAMDDHVVCYIEVGTAGNYYSASEEGIATTYFAQLKAAGDLSSNKLSGYPEYFINVNATSAVSIIESMIKQQCANKGFDAVETDLDETYDNNEGTTPWTITEANEQTYLTTLADYMHSLGLGWIAKDLDDTGDGFAGVMEPLASGIITEQCNQNDTCGQLTSYEGRVAVLNAEYESSLYPGFCTYDEANGINGALFKADLDGPRSPCPGPASPTKASTTITTSLSGGGQTGTSIAVPVDTGVTDAATLTGTDASEATGTVTYSLYSDPACADEVGSADPVSITTPGTMPGSSPVTLTDAGTYYWQASYSGDSGNDPSTSQCGSEVEVVTGPAAATITTSLSGGGQTGTSIAVPVDTGVTDAATLTGTDASEATGTVTYSLYSDPACADEVGTADPVSITTPGTVPGSSPVTLANAGTYYWQASYSGDSGNDPSTSQCGSEVEVVTGPAAATITTSLSGGGQTGTSIAVPVDTGVTDAATLTGSNASEATGTVTYSLYSDPACADEVGTAEQVSITTPGTVPQSSPVTLTDTGTYYWQASYSGDSANDPTTSQCGSEVEVAAVPADTAMTTSLSGSGQTGPSISVPAGTGVTDAATLAGDNADEATGTVTYSVYSDAACTDQVGTADQVSITTPGVIPESSPVILTTPVTYYWQATYSGDGLNGTSASTCGPGDDVESVYTSSLSLTKSTTSTGYGAVGQAIPYSYLVTNTGTTTISSIGINDNKIASAGITCPASSLAPGVSESCSATYTTTQADVDAGSVTNVATATGTDPSGTAVTSIQSTVSVPADSATASLSLTKSTTSTGYGATGQSIPYRYLVTNTGTTTVSSIGITDNKIASAGITCAASSLAPGVSESCSATYTTTQADVDAGSVTNSATATGKNPQGATLTSNQSTVTVPFVQSAGIGIVKTTNGGNGQDIAVGSAVAWSYVVTNTGSVTLSNVTVTDNKVASKAMTCAEKRTNVVTTLALKATVTCTATGTAVAGAYTDTGTVTGTPPGGAKAVTATSIGSYFGSAPAISLTGSASPTSFTGSNQKIIYSYVVKNTGNVALTSVGVTENQMSASCPSTTLAAGGSETCTATYTTTTTDVKNKAITTTGTATGTPPVGAKVTATSSVKVSYT